MHKHLGEKLQGGFINLIGGQKWKYQWQVRKLVARRLLPRTKLSTAKISMQKSVVRVAATVIPVVLLLIQNLQRLLAPKAAASASAVKLKRMLNY